MPTSPPESIAERFAAALRHFQARELARAESFLRQIIADEPRHADSWRLLGLVLRAAGRRQEAVGVYEQALLLNPNYVEAHGELGILYMELDRAGDAATSFKSVLALNPALPEGYYYLGRALLRQGKPDEAIGALRRSIEIRPDFAEAHHELGDAYYASKQLAEAVASYERALILRAGLAETHNNLGSVLKLQGDPAAAMRHFERAIALKPGFAEAQRNLGDSYQERGRLAEAAAAYERAIAVRPDLAEAHNNLGIVLQKQGRFAAAAEHFDRAIALNPDFAEAQLNVAASLYRRGEMNPAIEHCELALALKPDYAAAMFARCTMQLPILYADEAEIAARRTAYEGHLASLCEFAKRSGHTALATGIGAYQPFRLPYQGQNDRTLQSSYGSLACRIMSEMFSAAPMPRPPAADEPVRVGIVSGYFRDHSNWKMPIKGWLSQLDPKRFELFGYHTGTREDGETAIAESLCRRFVRAPLSDAGWREAILADAPHVLIYPEVGMDPVSVRLAAQRLAPVQCNSWGHPETSGFPTLDYFLSSELMEPADGEAHYTEQLVRLPNLSIYYEPQQTAPVAMSRSDLGLGPSTVYWCGQSLFKYLPQYDLVLPRIAHETADCQFVFIEYPHGTAVTEQFRRRLQRSFAALGLSVEKHCVILPRLDAAKFAAAAGLCDVVLDSIGWSGCNSTLEVLPTDLPVVTIGSAFMRGRHTMAILRMMGVSDTIAASLDDYVNIAVRLARDSAWRSAVRAKVRDNKHRVLRDRAAIAGLEDFLDAAVRNALT